MLLIFHTYCMYKMFIWISENKWLHFKYGRYLKRTFPSNALIKPKNTSINNLANGHLLIFCYCGKNENPGDIDFKYSKQISSLHCKQVFYNDTKGVLCALKVCNMSTKMVFVASSLVRQDIRNNDFITIYISWRVNMLYCLIIIE